METLTAEQIAKHYSAALDSVALINQLMALDSRDEKQTATVARNVEHLKLWLLKTIGLRKTLVLLTPLLPLVLTNDRPYSPYFVFFSAV